VIFVPIFVEISDMLKTRKSVAERLRITKKKKVLRRRMQLGHCKAKESGKVARLKRKNLRANEHPEIQKAIRKYLPNIM
jgi:ribosomal protein L35